MDTRLLMVLQVKVGTPHNLGAVPHGIRRTAPLSGGSFEGPRLRGSVVAGGSVDWQVLRSDGVLEMDLRVTLQTDDGALIHEVIRLASRAAGSYRGHRARRNRRSCYVLLSDDAAI